MVYTLRFFSLQNAVCFIILTYLVPVLFSFYIQGVLKLKKKIQHQKVNTKLVTLTWSPYWLFIIQFFPIKSPFGRAQILNAIHSLKINLIVWDVQTS